MYCMLTRGFRNNNPLNIRRGSVWKGLTDIQSDPHFCQFKTMPYGIRAALSLLRTYHYRYHLNTISEIIYRWAPPTENNTEQYIYIVKMNMRNLYDIDFPPSHDLNKLRYDITDDFVVNTWSNSSSPCIWIKYLLMSMSVVENGRRFSDEDYRLALTLLP